MDRFNVAVKVVQNAGELLRQCRLEEAEVSQKTGIKTLSPVGTAGSNNCCEMKY